ncbi:hypothetical protein MRX96_043726 [Rhipicephalus microplus]
MVFCVVASDTPETKWCFIRRASTHPGARRPLNAWSRVWSFWCFADTPLAKSTSSPGKRVVVTHVVILDCSVGSCFPVFSGLSLGAVFFSSVHIRDLFLMIPRLHGIFQVLATPPQLHRRAA